VVARVRQTAPDVVHGHGSKGGLFARAPALARLGRRPVRAYTPHGGSFNFKPDSAISHLYMATEAALARATDIFLFESAYIGQRYDERVGYGRPLRRVVLNGIAESETVPVAAAENAVDFVYVGELRSAKGIDTMLDALKIVAERGGRKPSAILVGSGPDEAALREHAGRLGLADCVEMPGVMPARQAFALGRVLVVPSRAESLPYVVIEAVGARKPMIATDVGGIPEIFGPFADRLIPPDNAEILAGAMTRQIGMTEAERDARAGDVAEFVRSRFTIPNMVDSVVAGYRDAIAARAERPSFARAATPTPSQIGD
jgi:glycosyltransferase involved in cell wall biosynthesis